MPDLIRPRFEMVQLEAFVNLLRSFRGYRFLQVALEHSDVTVDLSQLAPSVLSYIVDLLLKVILQLIEHVFDL